MEELTAEEAFFGEENRAHTALSVSCDREFGKRLAHLLDLPSQAPPSLILQSSLSGFAFEDTYVIARISPDDKAARPGMVFSHALIFPEKTISRLNDIGSIFRALYTERPPEIHAVSKSFPVTPIPKHSGDKFPSLVNALLTSAGQTTVLSATNNLEAIIVSIWPYMFPGMRFGFSFRMSFSPDEIGEGCVDLVSTPQAMLSRWPVGQIVEHPDQSVSSLSPAALCLLGDESNNFKNFIAEIDPIIDGFPALARADRAFVRLENPGSSFSDLVAAARLIGALQPNASRGGQVKHQLIRRLCDDKQVISTDDVLRLRNFASKPFAEGDELWQRIRSWTPHQLVDQAAGATFADLFRDARDEKKATLAWRNAIWGGLKGAPTNQFVKLAATIWHIVSCDPTLLTPLLKHCPDPAQFDGFLANGLSEIDLSACYGDLGKILIDHGFVEAEAVLLCQANTGTLQHVIEQLAGRGRSHRDARAIDRALNFLSDIDLVSLPSTIAHPHLFERAVDKLVGQPKLILTIDYMDRTNQKLWASALKKYPDLWGAGEDFKSVLFTLMSGLADGAIVETALLEELAKSPIASLLDHPRRSGIWKVLPSTARNEFLNATAVDWITNHFAGNDIKMMESDLATTLVSDPHKTKLLSKFSGARLQPIVNALSVLDKLEEHDLTSVLSDRLGPQQGAEDQKALDSLGRLLVARRWQLTVETLSCRYSSRSDLRPLFMACSKFVPFLTRWRMNISRPNNDELWSVLEDTTLALYPSGPSESNIWERAGGRDADLPTTKTGGEKWGSVLRRMRKGSSVRPQKLIAAMLDDYRYNPTLQYLADELPSTD